MAKSENKRRKCYNTKSWIENPALNDSVLCSFSFPRREFVRGAKQLIHRATLNCICVTHT